MKSYSTVAIFLLLCMGGCDFRGITPELVCKDFKAMKAAALHNIEIDEKDRITAQRQVDQLKVWAQTLPDPCEREAYMSWVRVYQKEIDDLHWAEKYQKTLPHPPAE